VLDTKIERDSVVRPVTAVASAVQDGVMFTGKAPILQIPFLIQFSKIN
jgi:hypothetical protein